MRYAVPAIFLLLSLFLPKMALAHREDYLDETLVFETLDEGEFEPEYWFDFGSRSGNNFVRHNFAMEYGITHFWMIDGRVTFENASGSSTVFDSGRLETRYRFYEEGTLPIDIALSAEFDFQRERDGSYDYSIEPRLILSKDFKKLNLTLNFSDKIPINSGRSGFEIASGLRYNFSEFIHVGCEFKQDIKEHEGALIPQIWFIFSHGITFKTGYSIGLSKNEEKYVRFVLEVEF